MALTDPIAALQDALLAHLAAAVSHADYPTIQTRRGWPEADTELHLSTGPVLVTVAGEDTATPVHPRPLGQTADDETLYRVALLEVPLQLHLFCRHRAALDDLSAVVDAALSNQLPASPDLWLSSTGYHDRPLTFRRGRFRRIGATNNAAVGEWEAVWSLSCDTDRVLTADHPALVTLTTQLTDLRIGTTESTSTDLSGA